MQVSHIYLELLYALSNEKTDTPFSKAIIFYVERIINWIAFHTTLHKPYW